tara:strand:+ start:16920 stop:18803 length:1884 start_codon:yes stop_codon:yes gene_type:complete
MCGFVGYVKNSDNKIIDKSIISNMNKALSHRGPDNENYFETENLIFGFSRLSIIDLNSRSNQPMKTNNNEFIIVFNGEIYNYLEIRKELNQFFEFNTAGDTEVLLNAYRQWGTECLNKIKGMFSFCIYDKKKNILFCARDHFGQKPFFYFYDNTNFVFASELRSLIKFPLINKKLNTQSITNYLHYDAFVGDETIIQNCYKLKKANYLIYDFKKNSLEINSFWKNDFKKNDLENIQEKFENVFEDSCRLHLRSDVPIAIYLSGGLDSTSIACMSKKILKYKNLKAFTLTFGEKTFDENTEAEATAKKLNLDLENVLIRKNEISTKILNLLNKLDEPLADIGYISTGLIAERLYEQNFKVVLSGDGGDELFGGYEPFLKLKYFNYLKKFFFSKQILNLLSKFFKDDFNYMSLGYKMDVFKKGFLKNDEFYNSRWLCSFLPEEIGLMLNEENFKKSFNPNQIYNYIDRIIKNTNSLDQYDKLLSQYQNHYLPDLICSHTDKANMIYSIEARSPFLDKDLFELMNATENKKKYKKNFSKIFLREFLNKNDLSKSANLVKKKGFAFPAAKLINTSLKENIEKSFKKNNCLEDIINPDYIYKYLDDHYNHKKNNFKKIWNLFVLNEWINYNL